MEFTHFRPSDPLKPYIRYYYLFVSDAAAAFEDTVFPSGDMEVIFNLGAGTWEAGAGSQFRKNPPVELWGQITKPLPIRSKGRHTMLGIRFLTHAAACFFNDEMGIFNDRVSDLSDIIGQPVKSLHAQLLETTAAAKRIALVEQFLLQRLRRNEKRSGSHHKVAHILTSIRNNAEATSISNIASQHGITPRYLQKLIYQHTGLSPKSFNKICRFQQSLQLITRGSTSLTAIAYDCGYFDQSHFIRDFKSFTGLTPSAYLENQSPVSLALAQ
ncbi:MAG TPA: helix-turn-helix transcriptional regulator [Chitinophaga sp.]|uniref:helix-turn-helix transcriptional regulator n=1 Tax=Chitinophaga sp. TaxID=1869181 RepID=UPI002DBC6B8B|nr:helix-turn-helix transcriptional regulator [Chitinophaga sp.]HEU4553649.1 helix-turn-helix transcriptional regulator [Chitinophaga sp.]